MHPLSRRGSLGGVALLVLSAWPRTQAWAQAATPAPASGPAGTPRRIRGHIAGLDGPVLRVVTREGPSVDVTLAETLTVSALRRVVMDDITKGTSVGVVAEPGPDGELKAVAITVLPPGMRITERQVAWDLSPGTSMNDGPVEAVVESSAGRDLTLRIHGKEVLVRVTPDTPLLMPVPAARTDLVTGAAVFINALQSAEGRISAARVTVGKDGVDPAI
ncbi:hypothetical protein E0493_21780 [Roseomonas sp. M0104]|uniref:DUF5666 domain-containing protein n=1 Tax=Teichococcus coralli TaxID=2545983 RepID=A0A845BFX0_9PROT|nr:hypothetical protein [Pseudoroseomonas coralli]MXP65981.1 hypothetical protein [Pseudoroseomonas coralli]